MAIVLLDGETVGGKVGRRSCLRTIAAGACGCVRSGGVGERLSLRHRFNPFHSDLRVCATFFFFGGGERDVKRDVKKKGRLCKMC